MLTPTTPTIRPLDNGLVLKSIGTEEEVERLAAFNGLIHGEDVIGMTRALIRHHPNTRPEHWLYIEDEATGQIVSSLCLIPWTWRYEDVELKAGEMGIVGTLAEYRHRGLIRALDVRFKELLHEGEFDLSQIQGIPYFYRQFGYEYAMPLEGGWQIMPNDIPDDLPASAASYRFREATLDDLPVLLRLYDDAVYDLSIYAVRDEAAWRFLFEHQPDTATAGETWLALAESGEPVGYCRIEQRGFGDGLTVNEVSRLSQPAAVALLRHLKTLAIARDKPYIRLNTPEHSSLIQAARHHGARSVGRYAWQIHLPDPVRLLHKIAPVFEHRIAASPLAGLTRTFRLDLYREAIDLRFDAGKLVTVETANHGDGGDLRLPPHLLAPLVLGHRSREELRYIFPDVSCWGEPQYLADVLFPKVVAFIYTIY